MYRLRHGWSAIAANVATTTFATSATVCRLQKMMSPIQRHRLHCFPGPSLSPELLVLQGQSNCWHSELKMACCLTCHRLSLEHCRLHLGLHLHLPSVRLQAKATEARSIHSGFHPGLHGRSVLQRLPHGFQQGGVRRCHRQAPISGFPGFLILSSELFH